MEERVYQADPATCIRVAKDFLREALDNLGEGEDWGIAQAKVQLALSWLPSWLEQEWDDAMRKWIATENQPEHTARPPHPDTMAGR